MLATYEEDCVWKCPGATVEEPSCFRDTLLPGSEVNCVFKTLNWDLFSSFIRYA